MKENKKMQNFSNEIIDTDLLPKYEEVIFTKLHPKYIFVVAIKLAILIITLIAAPFIYLYFEPDGFSGRISFLLGLISPFVLLFIVLFALLSFRKKGFAFREHDVLYRYGVLATNTIIIPYNRVQHVALHEGFIPGFFGLAEIEIFTAGGSSSDIQIPGIEKEQAENIKQLLMVKIQKQL
ncbi:PH domain-containing protein [Flavobacterium sp. FPG59]|uniref:PH domain-containing protein n=1 Tax=Flavobacterium sp. FPG59 TaxID=1929267 RepID=UPI0020CDF6F5|nr:PH domain-containing protein [Flavobacterium sp. FPG59]